MRKCKECGYEGNDFLKGFLICNSCVIKHNIKNKSQTDEMKEIQIIKNCDICGADITCLSSPIHRINLKWYCDKCWNKYKIYKVEK